MSNKHLGTLLLVFLVALVVIVLLPGSVDRVPNVEASELEAQYDTFSLTVKVLRKINDLDLDPVVMQALVVKTPNTSGLTEDDVVYIVSGDYRLALIAPTEAVKLSCVIISTGFNVEDYSLTLYSDALTCVMDTSKPR